MSKIDIDKFICSWMESRAMMSDNECGFVQQALADQGLEYKDGKIESIEQDESFRKRYERIGKSEWFKKTHEGMSVTVPSDLKGTDMDGGARGDIGEQGLTEFEKEVSKMLYVVSKSPLTFEGDPDYVSKNWANRLLVAARRQFEGNPEFLYTATRKAAERAKKEFLDNACRWFTIHEGEELGLFGATIEEFKKYTEE